MNPPTLLAASLVLLAAMTACGSHELHELHELREHDAPELSNGATIEPTAPTHNWATQTFSRNMPAADPGAEPALDVAGSRLTLVYEGGSEAFRTATRQWVRASAEAVASYYGEFPVPTVRVEIVPRFGAGVGFGQAFAGRRLRIRVGRRSEIQDLAEDWVLVHEMLHLGFPMLHRRHRWMREGLSTYVEPIVRARAGLIDESGVWARFTSRMHHGLPQSGDRGLDHTPTWGRVYWGGALYWMLADLRIRQSTEGRRSLQDALRGIARAGGTARHTWPIRRALRAGDAATGTTVLIELYEAMRAAPYPVDLESLWNDLGVTNPASLDDGAPLAELRHAITR